MLSVALLASLPSCLLLDQRKHVRPCSRLFFPHCWSSAPRPCADESRSSSSDFYKENFGAKCDDPIEKLPAFENGWRSHHPHGVQKKYAGGH